MRIEKIVNFVRAPYYAPLSTGTPSWELQPAMSAGKSSHYAMDKNTTLIHNSKTPYHALLF